MGWHQPTPTIGIPTITIPASGDATGVRDPVNLQAAIDSLRGRGGTVGLTADRYYIGTQLVSYPGIGIVGVGPLGDTVVNQSTVSRLQLVALNAAAILYKADANLNPIWPAFPYVANLSIFGTGSVGGLTLQDAIAISDVNGAILDGYFNNVIIANMGGDGYDFSASGIKARIDGGWYIEHCVGQGINVGTGETWINGGYVYDCANALKLGAASGNVYLHGVALKTSKAAGWGIDATGYGGKLYVLGGQFWDNPGGAIKAPNGMQYLSVLAADLQNNGDSTHPAIVVGLGNDGFAINNNKFTDSRGGSAVTYFVSCTQMQGVGDDNVFAGHQGALPVSITSNINNAGWWRDSRGMNPVGPITNPLDDVNRKFIGLTGTTATPTHASTDYTVKDVDQFLTVSGGTGVAIVIKDQAGNTVDSPGATITRYWMPVGWKINFGAYSVAPTVASVGN